MTTAEKAYRSSSEEMEDRNELIVRELPQVRYIAARIRERLPRHVEMDDLVHAGVLGLIEATSKYDPSKNAEFSTFAKFRIRGAILDSLRKLDWGSRSLRKTAREIAAASAALASRLGREPTQEEIAADLNMNLEELQSTLSELDGLYIVGQRSEHPDNPSASHDLIESAPSLGNDNPFELCLRGEMREQLNQAIAQLPEREQLILAFYYQEEMTMKEIAGLLNIGCSRVSQILSATLSKLRQSLQHLQEHPAVFAQTAQASMHV